MRTIKVKMQRSLQKQKLPHQGEGNAHFDTSFTEYWQTCPGTCGIVARAPNKAPKWNDNERDIDEYSV